MCAVKCLCLITCARCAEKKTENEKATRREKQFGNRSDLGSTRSIYSSSLSNFSSSCARANAGNWRWKVMGKSRESCGNVFPNKVFLNFRDTPAKWVEIIYGCYWPYWCKGRQLKQVLALPTPPNSIPHKKIFRDKRKVFYFEFFPSKVKQRQSPVPENENPAVAEENKWNN